MPYKVPGPFSDQVECTLSNNELLVTYHTLMNIFKVPDVSDKTEMDVRVVELIEFPPTEFTISNIFRGSF